MSGAAAAGLSSLVVRYYLTDDLGERQMLHEIMRRGIDIDGDRREDQAVRIISALDRALNNKKQTHTHG